MAREQVDHFEGLSDIIRLNIWRWKQTLSGANKPIQILDHNGQPTVIQVPNDYVVDLLYRYRIGISDEEQSRNTQIQKVRIFFTQNGLMRVMEVDD